MDGVIMSNETRGASGAWDGNRGASRLLADQVAIVTGASSGIGFAVARALVAAGAAVVIDYRSHGEEAQGLADEINATGGRAIAVEADVSSEADVARLFTSAVEAFGAVDILVANSGLQRDAASAEMTLDDWNTVISVNLSGQFLCAREAIRCFRRQRRRGVSRAAGKIVCMSSVHQVIPWAGHVNYAASKGGVMLMMQTLAQEYAAEGIRINSVAPGAIRTPINEDALRGDSERRVLELIPYGRIGEPDDVARAVCWLVSDDADYVVGTTLFVDGGMTLYPGFKNNG
jgi:glucose 1-dehydrogenase